MYKKIVGFFICILLIGITVLPVAGDITKKIHQNIKYTSAQKIPGIYFYQVDYKWTYSTFINSDTGLIIVNIDELKTATGLESGYVNVYTMEGWVVNNLAIIQDSTTNIYPYPTIGTYFDLGQNGDVTSIGAYIEYTAEPYVSFVYSAALPPYPVEDTVLNAQGGEEGMTTRPAKPPNPDTLPGPGGNFNPLGLNVHCVQKEHPNVETANNQCVPMAYANNLQYLEDWFGTYIQQDHILGLGLDGSLVGTLEHYMGREFIDRAHGNCTSYNKSIIGLVNYTWTSSVTGIDIRHQGRMGNQDIVHDDDPSYVSYGQGLDIKFDFIFEEICMGSAVELAWRKPTSGHMVQIVAAGYICDVPYVIYLDDFQQIAWDEPGGDGWGTNPPWPQQKYLIDIDKDGKYNLLADPEDTDGPAEVVCIYVQQSTNSPPKKPERPVGGELIMEKDVVYDFSTKTTDPNLNQVWYQWSWGDNIFYYWEGPFPSGQKHTRSHYWVEDGTYEVKVRAKDDFGAVSEWSDPRICVVPKSNIYDKNIFVRFLDRHSNLFPILWHLLLKL